MVSDDINALYCTCLIASLTSTICTLIAVSNLGKDFEMFRISFIKVPFPGPVEISTLVNYIIPSSTRLSRDGDPIASHVAIHQTPTSSQNKELISGDVIKSPNQKINIL